jgi:hypothetical protein
MRVTERPEPANPTSELTPDELEQRQRPDGTLIDDDGAAVDIPEGPIDADVLEQHQPVEVDDEDDHPRE